MKTRKNIQIWTAIICVVILYFIPTNMNAQRAAVAGQSFTNENESVHVITKLSSDFIAGKVIINWSAVNMDGDCTYQIERSENAKNFEVIGDVKGYATIGNYELVYTFVDKSPLSNNSFYKVSVKSKPEIQVSMEKAISMQSENHQKADQTIASK